MTPILIAFAVGVLIVGLLLSGLLYAEHRRRTTSSEWWKTCVEALNLPVDTDSETAGGLFGPKNFEAEAEIEGRAFHIRQTTDSIITTRSEEAPEIKYRARFDFDGVPFRLVNHLDADDPVSLRTGMPKLDQQSVVKTNSPIATLRTFEHEGVPGKLYRAEHLGGGIKLDAGAVTLQQGFIYMNPGIGRDKYSAPEAMEELENQLTNGVTLCDQLETAQKPRDIYWRPRTDLAKAWKDVAGDEGLDFACSECHYEDAALEGQWAGREIVAHTEGKGDRPLRRMVLTMGVPDKPYEIEFGLVGQPGAGEDRNKLLESIARGEHDLSTDDKNTGFDRVYEIRGDRISAYGNLGRPGVETALLKLYRPGIDISIEAGELQITLEDPPDTESELRTLLADVTTVADALEGETNDLEILESIEADRELEAG